ncbi:RNA polymerase sigma factor SigB [Rosistilla carotiformis]|uniref:RNA polymerase sigma factor SigB n=1 Tax=Rosistilla carotiformis TaxID=2528017 RepID=A0A518JTE6_9BACT|nr:sigma-70 family RNA polymerase sigma factor [Rosistilla carotiformis]QDV68805.1 RNA polymerase sigma factor SigB [Rosistilla carotiformis]
MIIALRELPNLRFSPKYPYEWFHADGLVSVIDETGPIDSWRNASPTQFELEKQRLMNLPLEFIDNPQFHLPGAGSALFECPIDLERDVVNSRSSSESLPTHLDRLCSAKLLSPEQEPMLFERMNFLLCMASKCRDSLPYAKTAVQQVDRIHWLLALAAWHRDRIIEANLRLVFSIVKKFVNPMNTFDDLLADGMLALIRAVEKFDYSRGFRFSTYATQVVRRNSYQLVVQRQTDDSRMVMGMDEATIAESGVPREPFMSEQRWEHLRSRLGVLLDSLDRREKLIIRARFSIGPHSKVQTLQAIAARLGISKERVRQIESRAITKLQEMASMAESPELQSV